MAEKAVSRKKKTSPRGASLIGITLIHTEIDFAETAPTEDVFEFDYTVEVDDFGEAMTDVYVCTVDLAITRNESESKKMTSRFAASYYCGFRVSGLTRAEIMETGKKFAGTSIWASFSALAAVTTSQMGIDFPVLPPSPSGVKIKEAPPEQIEQEEPAAG